MGRRKRLLREQREAKKKVMLAKHLLMNKRKREQRQRQKLAAEALLKRLKPIQDKLDKELDDMGIDKQKLIDNIPKDFIKSIDAKKFKIMLDLVLESHNE